MRLIYRAGWPSRSRPPRRIGWLYAWIGPWIIGYRP